MWSLINVSNNLHNTDVKLTGVYFSALLLDPFLNNGVTFASFHSAGTIPSLSDILKKIASGVLISFTISLSNLGVIPSTPGDLFVFIILIFLDIISGVTNNCPKCCDSSPSNFLAGNGSELI